MILPIAILIDILPNGIDADHITPLYSIVSFFLWFRFVYFLRIFKYTGHLTTIIRGVSTSMGPFLIIFLVILAAFGSSFYIVSSNESIEKNEHPFIESYLHSLAYAY